MSSLALDAFVQYVGLKLLGWDLAGAPGSLGLLLNPNLYVNDLTFEEAWGALVNLLLIKVRPYVHNLLRKSLSSSSSFHTYLYHHSSTSSSTSTFYICFINACSCYIGASGSVLADSHWLTCLACMLIFVLLVLVSQFLFVHLYC